MIKASHLELDCCWFLTRPHKRISKVRCLELSLPEQINEPKRRAHGCHLSQHMPDASETLLTHSTMSETFERYPSPQSNILAMMSILLAHLLNGSIRLSGRNIPASSIITLNRIDADPRPGQSLNCGFGYPTPKCRDSQSSP